jgi:hypothetical protein
MSAPSARFVEIPRAALEAAFAAAGFAPEACGSEVVFVRQHHRCQHLQVKVYSTLSVHSDETRGCGEDAIRVVAAYERDVPAYGDRPARRVSYGIFKGPRLHRTAPVNLAPEARVAAVIKRAIERARAAYAACNEHCKGERRCWSCCGKPQGASQGAPVAYAAAGAS